MANSYLHGVYANRGETYAANAVQAGRFPCYVGTAPVHLVRGYAEKNLVNAPVKLTQLSQAQGAIGYSDDWDAFTLCEPLSVHFNNVLGGVGPIYVINVLDPAKHKKNSQTTQQLTFVNKRAEFLSDTIVLDSLAIGDKAEGEDYALDYDYASGKVIVRDLKGDMTTASCTFDEVDASMVEDSDIIGGKTASGEYSGIGSLDLIGIKDFVHPSYLAAPGWSHIPAVRNALIVAAQSINSKFRAFVYTDIPVKGEDGGVDTIEEATAWKASHDYQHENECVNWPKGIDNAGKVYHLSTLRLWRQQMTDYSHDSIPFETASNKEAPVMAQYFGEGSKNAGFDEAMANELNAKGICTICPRGNMIVFWGGHTSAYSYGATTDAVPIFDTNSMMIQHLSNRFILEFAPDIDKPMTLQKRDEILNREQNYLNSLVTVGALIGSPKVVFLAADNTVADMLNGDFQFRDIATPTPQLKSLTVNIHYTDEGFSVFTESAS